MEVSMKKIIWKVLLVVQLCILLVMMSKFLPLPSSQQPKWVAHSLAWYYQHIRKAEYLLAPKVTEIMPQPASWLKIDIHQPPNYANYHLDFYYVIEPSQRTIYFNKAGQLSQRPVKDGFFRKIWGKTPEGHLVVQDFYQNTSRPQTSAFKLKVNGNVESFDVAESVGITATFDQYGQLETMINVDSELSDGLYFKNKKLVARMLSDGQDGQILLYNEQQQIDFIARANEQTKIVYFYRLYESRDRFKYMVKINPKDSSQNRRSIWDKEGFPLSDAQAPFPLNEMDSDVKKFEQVLASIQ